MMKVDDKAIENVYDKFREIIPEWLALIDSLFLEDVMKKKYKALIAERCVNLSD